MFPKDCMCVVLLALVLCVGVDKVHGGKIIFPESVESREAPIEESEVNEQSPESRGLWESDLFFLQKLSGLFGGGEEEQKKQPSRHGGLRPEPLPPQLRFPPNRRVGGNHRPQPNPQQIAPGFQLYLAANPPPRHVQALKPPQQNLSPPDLLPQHSQNVIAIQIPRPPPPPPSPPPSLVTEPASSFPYTFVRPFGITPPSVNQRPPLLKIPSRVDQINQALTTELVPIKPVKSKKPTLFGSLPDLTGAFSITQKPRLSVPTRPRPQPLHHQQSSSFVSKPHHLPPKSHQLPPKSQHLPQKPIPQVHRPHPRPAPQPQKQHPRPPPQPQRVIIHPPKPTAIHKKPIYPDFKPSPQEGSILADAFQPVFVASPNMDELDNDIMKPMHVGSPRSAGKTTTTTNLPILVDFF